jgi:hypothetical protein
MTDEGALETMKSWNIETVIGENRGADADPGTGEGESE